MANACFLYGMDHCVYIYESGYCYVLLYTNNNYQDWIFGQPFFKGYYTVFMDNYKIYLWKALEADLDKTQANYHESITLIKSEILIPVGLVISGIVFV